MQMKQLIHVHECQTQRSNYIQILPESGCGQSMEITSRNPNMFRNCQYLFLHQGRFIFWVTLFSCRKVHSIETQSRHGGWEMPHGKSRWTSMSPWMNRRQTSTRIALMSAPAKKIVMSFKKTGENSLITASVLKQSISFINSDFTNNTKYLIFTNEYS